MNLPFISSSRLGKPQEAQSHPMLQRPRLVLELTEADHQEHSPLVPLAQDLSKKTFIQDNPQQTYPGHELASGRSLRKGRLLARIAGAALISGMIPAAFHFWIVSGEIIPMSEDIAPINRTEKVSLPQKDSQGIQSETSTKHVENGTNEVTQEARSTRKVLTVHSFTPPKTGSITEDMDTDQKVREAYDAYQAGKLEEAFQHYVEALSRTPDDVDTLNALALISLRLGLDDEAKKYWQQTIQLDPDNAVAIGHLTALHRQTDPSGSERILRAQLARQPKSASLLFALGNVYAQQARWAEAQQMFFNAHTQEPEAPDVAYNLAVALDHLGQTEPASRFYLLAHSAGAAAPAAFNVDHASMRAQALLVRTTSAPH